MDEKIPPKPPIGLKPYYVWRSERIGEIVSAMERYAAASVPIPLSWVKELKEHLMMES